MKRIISSPDAPPAVGPYSQVVEANGFVFVSGQMPLDSSGKLVEGDIAVQTEHVMKNLSAIVKAAGSSMERAVKVNVYLKDLKEFAEMNKVYARYFPSQPPARATVEIARLAFDVKVEIDLIALAGQS